MTDAEKVLELAASANEKAAAATQCGACRHFVGTNEKQGFCHRFPPKALAIQTQGLAGMQLQVQAVRPPVLKTESCGEFRAHDYEGRD